MPYTIQQIDGLPAPTILNTITAPLDVGKDIPEMMGQANAMLKAIDGRVVYVIADVSNLSLSFSDIVQGLASALNPNRDAGSVQWYDPRVRTILIGSGTLLSLVVKSTRQDQYGNRQMELFETLDEALVHIRSAAIS